MNDIDEIKNMMRKKMDEYNTQHDSKGRFTGSAGGGVAPKKVLGGFHAPGAMPKKVQIATKEPYLMTKKEYGEYLAKDYDKASILSMERAKELGSSPTAETFRQISKSQTNIAKQLRAGTYKTPIGGMSVTAGHAAEIQKAISAGKKVPKNILAEFPDMFVPYKKVGR